MAGTLTISGTVGGPVEITGTVYWDGNTANGNYYPFTTTDGSSWESNWVARDLQQGGIVPSCTFNKKEEVKDMRGLFQFYVVDPEKSEVIGDGLVIAKNKETAKIKGLAPFADKHDLDDLDIICNRLGDVRAKKEITEVRVVKND